MSTSQHGLHHYSCLRLINTLSSYTCKNIHFLYTRKSTTAIRALSDSTKMVKAIRIHELGGPEQVDKVMESLDSQKQRIWTPFGLGLLYISAASASNEIQVDKVMESLDSQKQRIWTPFGLGLLYISAASASNEIVLKWEDVEIGEPKEGEVKVKNKAIGINFIDIYFRKGVYKAATSPFTPGMEAVGEVTAVGPGLTGRQVGDIVAYVGNPMGAYTEEQILPADRVVPVPSSIDPVTAASIMLKGLTTQFLVRRCFKVEPGHTILVHAAAGGVGSLLCQWANALGATVIGTVSTKEKAAQAREDGCHHTIFYKDEDFVSRVNEITSGKGVDVVYDSVGKDTFEGSLACLKIRGYMVSFGQSSGTPDPVPLSAIAVKSLFLTRPTMMHYTISRDELLEAAGELFTNVASGVLRVRTNHTYPLSKAAQAHSELENRKTSGSIVLIPDSLYQ